MSLLRSTSKLFAGSLFTGDLLNGPEEIDGGGSGSKSKKTTKLTNINQLLREDNEILFIITAMVTGRII